MGKLKNIQLVEEEQSVHSVYLTELLSSAAQVESWCNRCGHYHFISPERLMKQVGSDVRVSEIGIYVECPSCRSKDIAARPYWPESELYLAAAE